MIHDALRRSVQLAIVARICGRATAVTISSRPARKTPTPRTISSMYEVRRDMSWSVRVPGGRSLDHCGGAALVGLLFSARRDSYGRQTREAPMPGIVRTSRIPIALALGL